MAASSSSESQNKAPTKEIELLEVSILKLPDLPLKGSTLEGETLGKPFGPCLDVTELFKPSNLPKEESGGAQSGSASSKNE